jgi:ATP adenylyltransferase
MLPARVVCYNTWQEAWVQSMRHIWAPWRMKFVTTHKGECVFCDVYQQTEDQRNLIVCRGRKSFVIVNRYPYTSGHLLVVANMHKTSLEDLDAASRTEMMELATHGLRVLRRIYQPEAFNLGANIGKAAGAGIVGHVHLHIVPRWSGDTNFMSVLAETRVLPEEPGETYRRVRAAWDEAE